MSKNITVLKCCAACPFFHYDGEMMDADCTAESSINFGSASEFSDWVRTRVHDHCPLKLQNITVKLKK